MEEIKCEQVGMLSGGKWEKCHETNRRVYSDKGLSPTITTMGGGQREPKIIEPIIYDDYNGRIRADQDCIGTLTTNCGNDALRNGVKIIEPRIAAMRGRNHDNPSDRTAGSPTEQRLEIGSEETSNTLTTVQKDNLVVEPICLNSKVDGKQPSLTDRVYNTNGISTCVTTTPFFMGNIAVQEYRIRKLTPDECFRLQAVKQEDFERVAENQSTSALYHEAGDSICCTCLMAIFGQLFGVDYNSKINELVGELKE